MKLKYSALLSLSVLAIMMFSSSCNTTVDITKRHYNSGFYVDISSKKPTSDRSIVKSKAAESAPAVTGIEYADKTVAPNPDHSAVIMKDEIKEESHPSYLPSNKKEKITAAVARQAVAFAKTIQEKENKVFAKTNSSGLQSSQSSMVEKDKALKLWIIFLIAAILLEAIGAGFLAWVAWIAFIVFFILWLIALAG